MPVLRANPTKQDLIAYTFDVAKWQGVDGDRMVAVIDCESSFKPKAVSPTHDSGIAQIHLAAHPDITRAQAFDPAFAIPWMAKQWSKGHQRMWSCYKKTAPI